MIFAFLDLSTILVLLGTVFLLISLVATLRPGLAIPMGLRGRWRLLTGLIFLFLAGNLAFLFTRAREMAAPFEMVTGAILCSGGFFVLLAATLLRASFYGLTTGEEGLDRADQ
ncbi:MAG: hypothetical protein P8Y63_13970 [Deltaproteobacteria bacterium]